MSTATIEQPAAEVRPGRIDPGLVQDAHHDVRLAVERGLAANWDQDLPRVTIVESSGIATVYVSTRGLLGPAARTDIRGAVRAALAPYVSLAPYTHVVFLTRPRA